MLPSKFASRDVARHLQGLQALLLTLPNPGHSCRSDSRRVHSGGLFQAAMPLRRFSSLPSPWQVRGVRHRETFRAEPRYGRNRRTACGGNLQRGKALDRRSVQGCADTVLPDRKSANRLHRPGLEIDSRRPVFRRRKADKFVAITFNNSQFGLLSISTGEFDSIGQG